MPTPKLTKAELREQLEAALANYSGPVTRCPPGTPPQDDSEQRRLDRALRRVARLQAEQRRLAAGCGRVADARDALHRARRRHSGGIRS
jgi:hypothetical protein